MERAVALAVSDVGTLRPPSNPLRRDHAETAGGRLGPPTPCRCVHMAERRAVTAGGRAKAAVAGLPLFARLRQAMVRPRLRSTSCRLLKIAGGIPFFMISSAYQPPMPKVATQSGVLADDQKHRAVIVAAAEELEEQRGRPPIDR